MNEKYEDLAFDMNIGIKEVLEEYLSPHVNKILFTTAFAVLTYLAILAAQGVL